jgi:hypothetical protein
VTESMLWPNPKRNGGREWRTHKSKQETSSHGLLNKIRDLGLPLLSVNRVEPGQADASDVKRQIGAR